MAVFIEMPKFGLSMEEGTITAWLKSEGEAVDKGEEIAEVTTEKITNTVEAPASGILVKILLQQNETAVCGANIGIIARRNEDISALLADTEPLPEPEQQPRLGSVSEQKGSFTAQGMITPKAQKFAEEKRVDYGKIVGTGIGGAITLADIKQYLAGQNSLNKVSTVERSLSEVRKTITRKMLDSIQTTAQATLTMGVDVTELVALYGKLKPSYQEAGIKLSYTAFILKAVALALQRIPEMAVRFNSQKNLIQYATDLNLGVAVEVAGGLLVPVLKKVDAKDLKTVCQELKSLTEMARLGQLNMDDLSGGVMTVTNLGMYGVKYFTPILNLPESLILGVGAILQEPSVKSGGIFIRSLITLSLTHDHRLIDGAPAARFLRAIKDALAQPERLLN